MVGADTPHNSAMCLLELSAPKLDFSAAVLVANFVPETPTDSPGRMNAPTLAESCLGHKMMPCRWNWELQDEIHDRTEGKVEFLLD